MSATVKPKTAARLAAIQVLYGRDITGDTNEPAAQALALLASHDDKEALEGDYVLPDEKMLLLLVNGTYQQMQELDSYITPLLNAGWDMDKLGAVMRALLRTATYELIGQPDIPTKVILSEYVTLARSFFSAAETGFVNGILDKIAKKVRE